MLCFGTTVFSQEKTESRELAGHIGSRDALLVLHATQRPDAGWQLTGEYLLLPTMTRRFLEGERSPQMGDNHTGSVVSFYHPVRGEQARDLDDDYADWRRDRYKRFSDEFDAWRRERGNHGSAAAPDATSGPGTPSSE
jgi:hypothetical protein